jgi:hypothetical protein
LGVEQEFVASSVGHDNRLLFSDGFIQVFHFAKDFFEIVFSSGFKSISNKFILGFNSIDRLLMSVNLFLNFFSDSFNSFESASSFVGVTEINGKVDLGFDSGVGLFLVIEGSQFSHSLSVGPSFKSRLKSLNVFKVSK